MLTFLLGISITINVVLILIILFVLKIKSSLDILKKTEILEDKEIDLNWQEFFK